MLEARRTKAYHDLKLHKVKLLTPVTPISKPPPIITIINKNESPEVTDTVILDTPSPNQADDGIIIANESEPVVQKLQVDNHVTPKSPEQPTSPTLLEDSNSHQDSNSYQDNKNEMSQRVESIGLKVLANLCESKGQLLTDKEIHNLAEAAYDTNGTNAAIYSATKEADRLIEEYKIAETQDIGSHQSEPLLSF